MEAGLATYALAVLGLSIKPGPGLVSMAAVASRFGIRGLLSYFAGAAVVETTYLAIFFSATTLFVGTPTEIPKLFYFAASAILVAFVVANSWSARKPDADPSKSSSWSPFTQGVLFTISNPLIFAFFAAIVPALFSQATPSLSLFLAVTSITLLIEGVIALAYLSPILFLRPQFIKDDSPSLRWVSSLMLLGVALYLAYRGLSR